MERMDDKLLRSKLDSLHELPQGYEPSLDSKWELLEAGIPEKKKRRVIVWWAAAAGIALLITLWIFSPSEKHAPAVGVKTNEAISKQNEAPTIAAESFPAANDKRSSAASVKRSQAVAEKDHPAPELAEQKQIVPPIDTILSAPVNESTIASAEPPVRTRKKKYIEIDFNDPVKEQKEEQQASAQPVKFRIMPTQQGDEQSTPSSLKLKKSF